MKQNIYLFTGEDRFTLLTELKKWKTLFITKYGAENLFEYKSDNFEPGTIINSIVSGGLFVSKKLVIVNGFPKDSFDDSKLPETKLKLFEEKFMQYFDTLSSDTIIIFVSNQPDKRTKSYKYLLSNVNVKEFGKPSKQFITSFIKSNLKFPIKDDMIEYLISLVGMDLFALYSEIVKLNYYLEKNQVSLTQVILDDVVFVHSSVNSFDILDAIFVNKKKALNLIQTLQIKSTDSLQFLGMLQRGSRVLISIMDLIQNGVTNSKLIAEKLSLHPFVASKNYKLAETMIGKKNLVSGFFNRLISLEYDLKTGKIPFEIFWLEIKKIIAGL